MSHLWDVDGFKILCEHGKKVKIDLTNGTKQMREGAVERCGIRDMDGEEIYGEKEVVPGK